MANSLGLVKLLLAPPARTAGAQQPCAEVEAWVLLIEGDAASCLVPDTMAALFELEKWEISGSTLGIDV